MPGSKSTTLPPDQLISLLRRLSDQILSSQFDTSQLLAQAAPVFAALHQVNRNSLVEAKECRMGTQDARLEMDAAHLRLQVTLHSPSLLWT